MNGSGQHAPHPADFDLHQAAVGTGDNCNTDAHAVTHESNAHKQMPMPGLCSCSSCGSSPVVPISVATYSLPLSALGLSTRLFLLLRHAGISTVGQILEMDLEALYQMKPGYKAIQELVRRVQALDLLHPIHQGGGEEPPQAASAGRRDTRQRPGRGNLRATASHQPLPQQELRISNSALCRFCYKVPVARLPIALRMTLPRWARCGIEQAEENKTTREELPRRTRYCYIQPFTLGETGELVEWHPGPAGDVPSHYRAAATPDAVRRAVFIEVDPKEAHALLRELVNAAAPSPLIRIAPAFILTEEMRAMIAPGVAFPDEFTVPENTSRTRVSIKQGNQVPILQWVAGMRIESLSLSEGTRSCLRRAGIMTVGALLELEEERLGIILDREGLWELYAAVFAKGVLPTPAGFLPGEQTDEDPPSMPVFETFYYYPTGITYDDKQLGRLYLVHAALFVDRLDGSRSGPVETLWLTRAQIGQSLIWESELERLDSLELRTRVTRHAIARGADLPEMNRAEDFALERRRQMLEMEEQYNRVPLRSEYKSDAPLELFISEEDLKAGKEEHLTPTSTVICVLEHYLEHPHAQPAGHRLSLDTLDAILDSLREDRKQLRQLNAAWKRQFPGQPHPAGPSIVMHEEYAIHAHKERNKETGRIEVKEIAELVGYRLIIGVLSRTQVPGDLIVEPRRTKPVFPAPGRPIRPCRTPNYMPIQNAA